MRRPKNVEACFKGDNQVVVHLPYSMIDRLYKT